MLSVIAHTEDAGHYRKPVSFFPGQLGPLSGLSASALKRARKKAIEAGWLHCDSGNKHQASNYWVVIPPHAAGLDDGPTDEQPGEYEGLEGEFSRFAGDTESEPRANRERTVSEPRANRETNSPIEDYLTLPLTLERAREFEKFWEQYPKKSKRIEAIREWAALNPSPELQDAILEAIGRHQRTNPDWLRDSGRYIPRAENWLRDRQWEWNQPKKIVRDIAQPTPEQLEAQRRRALGDKVYEATYGNGKPK